MRSIQKIDKLTSPDKELRLLIDSLKNVLTDVPYYIEDDDDEDIEDDFYE